MDVVPFLYWISNPIGPFRYAGMLANVILRAYVTAQKEAVARP